MIRTGTHMAPARSSERAAKKTPARHVHEVVVHAELDVGCVVCHPGWRSVCTTPSRVFVHTEYKVQSGGKENKEQNRERGKKETQIIGNTGVGR